MKNTKKEDYQKNYFPQKKLAHLLFKEDFNLEKSFNKLILAALFISFFFPAINILSTNSFAECFGLFICISYHIVLFFLFKKNIYSRVFKYITMVINLTGLSLILLGFFINSNRFFSLRTLSITCFNIVIILSGLYNKPHISIITGILAALEFILLSCYAIFFNNTFIITTEIFKDRILNLEFLFYQPFTFICLSIFVAYNSTHFIKFLKRFIYSDTNVNVRPQPGEKIIKENKIKQKESFFIYLANEIKTPLILIMIYLDLYLKKNCISNELNIIKQNVNILLKNIVNFIDIEKLEHGADLYNHNQVINLTELLNEKIQMFREISQKKKLTFNYNNPDNNIFIKIDPFAIDRIINNIVDNAIRYTNPGGKVSVLVETDDKKIKIIVKDTGIGIPVEHRKHIFNRFYRLSNEKPNSRGIGMGLNIVKCITDEVKADVKIKSELNKGSEFIITFNRYYVSGNEKIVFNSEFSDSIDLNKIKLIEEQFIDGRYNILVVEDNQEILSYIIENLQLTYNVFHADNGKHALVKLKRIPLPDLVISDIMQEEMDEYMFYNKFYENDLHINVPFIFLIPAISGANKKFEAMKNGSIDFLSKPFLIDVLAAKVESIFKGQIELENKFKQYLAKRAAEIIVSEVIKPEKNSNKKYIKFESKCRKYKITNREKDVIILLFEGLLHKEISRDLSISEHTVKDHVKRIYKKCGVQNKIELYKLFNQ